MEMRKLGDFFSKVSPNLFLLSIVLSIAVGLSFSLLIPFVIYSVQSDRNMESNLAVENYSLFNSPTAELASAFFLTCFFIIGIKTVSSLIAGYIADRGSAEHRLSLYDRIYNLSLADLEKIGQSRLVSILNIDIPAFTTAAVSLPLIWVNIVTIIGTLGYLMYLDLRVFLFVLVTLIIVVVTYQIPTLFAEKLFRKIRGHQDHVQQSVKGLIFGAKELKLDNTKFKEYFEQELLTPEKSMLKDSVKANSIFTLVNNYGEMISFVIIGIVIFQLPYMYKLEQAQLFGIVMALLYLTGPVGMLLSVLGTMKSGKVALSKVNALYSEIYSESNNQTQQVKESWNKISVNNLTYCYEDNSESSFSVGPISAEFNRGEVTFIIGGNGSGKTTLSKCISLHYNATSGNICFDEQVINENNLQSAREYISVIYSDFFLFNKLYGKSKHTDQQDILGYLNYLGLEDKIILHNGKFNTTLLSDGQRKRLALLVLLLEDKDICIFDEWAADQDPRFKEVFYSKILNDLKAKNKVVIVISHDDRYFDYADQLIFMEEGRIKNTSLKKRELCCSL